MKTFLQYHMDNLGGLPTHESCYRGWDTMMAMWECTKQAAALDDDSMREAMIKVKLDGLGGPLDYTKGDREGYSEFYEFILVDKKNIVLDDWLANGGYEAYKAATGNAK